MAEIRQTEDCPLVAGHCTVRADGFAFLRAGGTGDEPNGRVHDDVGAKRLVSWTPRPPLTRALPFGVWV